MKSVAFAAGYLRQKPMLVYGLAVAAVLIGTGVRLLLGEVLAGATFLTFFPAPVIAAVVGGSQAGLLASTLSCALAWCVVVPPNGSFLIAARTDALSLALFAIIAVMICAAIEGMLRALDYSALLLRQKDMLLTKIHRRLKNQLQFISSMLALPGGWRDRGLPRPRRRRQG